MIAPEGPALPHNIEAEAALLGALMLDNRLIEDVQLKLRPEHFFEPLHGRIYESILKMLDRNMLATPVTLRPMFEGDAGMRELGGPSYLAQLTGSNATLIGARDFANQLYDLALLRALIGVGRTMVEQALDTSADVDPRRQIEEAEAELARVAERSPAQTTVSGAECAGMVTSNFGMPRKGVMTGGKIPAWDEAVGPMEPGNLVVLGGRPGMGKTATAISVMLAAAQAGKAVLFFSIEMSAEEIGRRMLADLCFGSGVDVPFDAINRDDLSDGQRRQLYRAQDELTTLKIEVNVGSISIGRVARDVRRHKTKLASRGIDLGLVVVDYLGLLEAEDGKRSRYEEITKISRALKACATDNAVPVLALAQLSRDVEKREDKRPQLSDLRDSGSIEQDADVVCLVYRHEEYVRLKKPEVEHPDYAGWAQQMAAWRHVLELFVRKRRHGAPSEGRATYNSSYQAIR